MSWFNKPMNDRERRLWDKRRAMGKWPFIMIYGALIWGLSMAVFMSVLFALGDADFSIAKINWPHASFRAELATVLFPAGGVLFGVIVWHICERRFRAGK
jgi:hypothetical protein